MNTETEKLAWKKGFMTAVIIALLVIVIMLICRRDSFDNLIPRIVKENLSIPKTGREWLSIPKIGAERLSIPKMN